ncbi:hypothetical protein KR032_002062, partial [Drosophila birchii]
ICEPQHSQMELIVKYGFPAEDHYVYTADGYKLCMHRIPRPGGQPVLLVHGLMSSSASWVQLGPNSGLAYLLYLKGYDVWMLNTRGNIYSREHKDSNLGDSRYWDFSYHEIGIYDLPAALDEIIHKTQQQQVLYIGHSQGSTVFFVMCSERPEYAQKVSLMQSLSPTVYLHGGRSPVLKFLGAFNGGFSLLMELLGGHQISLKTTLIYKFSKFICSLTQMSRHLCALFEYIVCGLNWNSFNQVGFSHISYMDNYMQSNSLQTLAPIIEGHSSQGASAKQILHYAQHQGQRLFQHYDFGKVLNLLRYKSLFPPLYNLTHAISKVLLYSGSGDWMGSVSDADLLQRQLPNCIGNNEVLAKDFSHFDFTISANIRPLVYDQVISQ